MVATASVDAGVKVDFFGLFELGGDEKEIAEDEPVKDIRKDPDHTNQEVLAEKPVATPVATPAPVATSTPVETFAEAADAPADKLPAEPFAGRAAASVTQGIASLTEGIASAVTRQPKSGADVKSGHYLSEASHVQVHYAGNAGRSIGEVRSAAQPLAMQAPPSYSDFLKKMEAVRRANEAAEADQSQPEGSGTEAGATSSADGENAADGSGLSQRDNAEVAQADNSELKVAAGGTSSSLNNFDRSGAPLFPRRLRDGADASDLLLFFPSDGFSTSDLGNYKILTPINRFDSFTPPSQPLPKSSARFRSVP